MVKKRLQNSDIYIEEILNLDDVTSATEGDSIDTEAYNSKTIYVEVSSNTGAVTVNIQVSPNNSDWSTIRTKTYTAENLSDSFSYVSHFSYMRTTTTSHSSATVKTSLTGRS